MSLRRCVACARPPARLASCAHLPTDRKGCVRHSSGTRQVPSDSPDDYAALKELQDKPEWRKTFKTA